MDINYVMPMLPFALFCIIYYKSSTEYNIVEIIVMGICIFLASCSQEQWSITMVVFAVMLIIQSKINKVFGKLQILFFILSGMGACIVLLSPGIWERARNSGTDNSFIEQSFINITQLIRLFFGMESRLFQLVLFASLAIIAIWLFRHENSKQWKYFDGCCLLLFIVASVFYITNGFYKFTFSMILPTKSTGFVVLNSIGGLLVVLIITIEVVRYYIKTNNEVFLNIFCVSLVSIACLTFVNELPSRLMILPTFAQFVLIANAITEIRVLFLNRIQSKCVMIMVCVVISVLSVKNGKQIYDGYHENYATHIYNDYVLCKSSQQIKDGQKIDYIYLDKIPNMTYSCVMMYTPGCEFMKPWITAYYDLPNDVNIIYSE